MENALHMNITSEVVSYQKDLGAIFREIRYFRNMCVDVSNFFIVAVVVVFINLVKIARSFFLLFGLYT